MPMRWLLATVIGLVLGIHVHADERAGSPNPSAVFRPVGEVAPAGNAAMFIGVNAFPEDPNIPPLRFAVHDAIEHEMPPFFVPGL